MECFEFDFETSKINRLVRDEDLDEIKICLEDFYPYLFYAYKYYVSAFVNAAVPCITANSFNDFIR